MPQIAATASGLIRHMSSYGSMFREASCTDCGDAGERTVPLVDLSGSGDHEGEAVVRGGDDHGLGGDYRDGASAHTTTRLAAPSRAAGFVGGLGGKMTGRTRPYPRRHRKFRIADE